MLNSCSEDDWEIYEKEFDPKHFKITKRGPGFQVTDALPTGNTTEAPIELATEVWDPTKISAANLGKYRLIMRLIGTLCVRSIYRQFKSSMAISHLQIQ